MDTKLTTPHLSLSRQWSADSALHLISEASRRTHRWWNILGLAAVCAAVVIGLPTFSALADEPPTAAAPGTTVFNLGNGETRLVFQARDLLKPEVLRGPNYEVEPEVTLQGEFFLFRLRTPWGPIPALGMNMLEVRIREMYAIDRLRELSRDPQILQGIFDTLEQTPEGARILLTEPAAALLRVPKGLTRIISSEIDPRDRRAGNDVRRRLAVETGCDPETTNAILKRLLDNVALRKGVGQLVGKIGLSVALPGLGLIPATAQFKEIVAGKLPHEINEMLNAELLQMGVPEGLRRKFLDETQLTTTRRMLFVQHFRTLKHLENRDYLLHEAVSARNETEGLAAVQSIQLLAEFHRQDPLRRIVSVAPVLAVAESGTAVVAWSADYVAFGKKSTAVAEALQKNALPNGKRTLRLSGQVSAEALRQFQQAEIEVVTGP